MFLHDFIRTHHEDIIREFAAFAMTLMPPGAVMTDAELRDHAKEILTAIVEDIQTPQGPREQHRKSQGRGALRTMEASGRLHATDRIEHGYAFEAVLAEVRERRAAEEKVTALFRRLVSAQDEERKRIARDIHDQLGQAMTALKMNLEALDLTAPSTQEFSFLLHRSQRLVGELDRAIDFLTWELRPGIDQMRLSTALEGLVKNWSERFGITADFAANGEYDAPPDAQEHLYRVTQEALHNVAKHAAADHVSVMVDGRTSELVLRNRRQRSRLLPGCHGRAFAGQRPRADEHA